MCWLCRVVIYNALVLSARLTKCAWRHWVCLIVGEASSTCSALGVGVLVAWRGNLHGVCLLICKEFSTSNDAAGLLDALLLFKGEIRNTTCLCDLSGDLGAWGVDCYKEHEVHVRCSSIPFHQSNLQNCAALLRANISYLNKSVFKLFLIPSASHFPFVSLWICCWMTSL